MSFYKNLAVFMQAHINWPAVTDAEFVIYGQELVQDEKSELPNERVLAAILNNRAEFATKSDADKQLIRDILYIGDTVPTATGNPARDALVSIFGGGSDTIQELVGEINIQITRLVEAGIPQIVEDADYTEARRRIG